MLVPDFIAPPMKKSGRRDAVMEAGGGDMVSRGMLARGCGGVAAAALRLQVCGHHGIARSERHREAAFHSRATDPWAAMFTSAARATSHSALRDIEPFWVYGGSARIERHVPLLPLCREVEKLTQLQRSLAAYRLVFGQPRQEDLVAYLGDQVPPEMLERLVHQLRIDLTPR